MRSRSRELGKPASALPLNASDITSPWPKANVPRRCCIKLKVLVAPLAVMLLFIGVSAVAVSLLRSQGEAFREVVGAAFDAATTTSRMSLAVASIHSDIIRHLDVIGTRQNTESLKDLRDTLARRFDRVEAMLQSIETNAPTVDRDLLHDTADFFAVYRIVATRVVQTTDTNPTLVSTLMAHYSQLDAYLGRMADQTIRAAKERQQRTEALVARTVAIITAVVAVTF